MKEQAFVSAVVYVHNEQDSVADGIMQLDATLHRIFDHYEIILIDDASTDLTLEQARELDRSLSGTLIMISLSRKHGIEKAMIAGLNKSIGDFVLEFETTRFDHALDLIPAMFRTTQLGVDIVVASPAHGLPWTSKLFYTLVNKISYLQLDLRTESIRIISRRALNAMLNLKEKVRYRKALYAFSGYKKQVFEYTPIHKSDSRKSGLNRENISTAFDVVVSFSNIGLKLAHYLSILFLLFSLFMTGYAFYNYFFNKDIVEGWTTLMILISVGFTGLFFIIGMLGEYISRILIEIQSRPFYTTSSVEVLRPARKQDEADHAYEEVVAGKEAGGDS